MKKNILLLLAILLTFGAFLPSCSEQSAVLSSEFATSEDITAIYTIEGKPEEQRKQEILSLVNNELPCEQLIKTPYPDDMGFQPWTSFRSAHSSMPTPSITVVDDVFPIECLRDAGNGLYYAVYQTAEGGRIFCFFSQARDYTFSHSVYVYKPVSSATYNELQIGDPLSKVLKIDAALASGFDKQRIVNVIGLNEISCTFALLKDALVVFQYQQIGDGPQDVAISDIQVLRDKKLVINEDVLELQDHKRQPVREVFDFNILPQDYPG